MPPNELSADLVALLAARLCDALMGPVATVVAALPQPGTKGSPPLLEEAAGALAARLALFRAAFGPAEALDGEAIAALLSAAPSAHRVRFALSVGDEPLAPELARLIIVALLLAAEALPFGGVAEASLEGGSLLLVPRGERAAWPEALLRGLAGADSPPDPRGALASWLLALAHGMGWEASFALAAGPVLPVLRLSRA